MQAGTRMEGKKGCREKSEQNVRVTQHNSRPRCVFSLPNETVVILWSPSALERYTGGIERLARIADQQYRPVSDARPPRYASSVFAQPAAPVNLER